MNAWIREIKVILTSQVTTNGATKQMVFGDTNGDGFPLDITISGYKYMSSLLDTVSINIKNLTYSEIVKIIDGQYYTLEIQCGYKSASTFTIFKGGLLYISNLRSAIQTNEVTILGASELVASFGQAKLNLTMNSGINMYSAINYASKLAGIGNVSLSNQLKKTFLENDTTVSDTFASWLNELTEANSSYIINADSILGATTTLYDADTSNLRVIKLTSDNILLTKGYPSLTDEGLSFYLLPTFAFMCGDVIQLDNSVIQISVTDSDEIGDNYGYFLDPDGYYTIYEIQYTLQNRGATFEYKLDCKSRQLISLLSTTTS